MSDQMPAGDSKAWRLGVAAVIVFGVVAFGACVNRDKEPAPEPSPTATVLVK